MKAERGEAVRPPGPCAPHLPSGQVGQPYSHTFTAGGKVYKAEHRQLQVVVPDGAKLDKQTKIEKARILAPADALALACASNVGSAATLIGNPQNMFIGEALTFLGAYVPESLLVMGLGAVSTVLVLIRVLSIPDDFFFATRGVGIWIALAAARCTGRSAASASRCFVSLYASFAE
mgnify:CR=1 FL=1